MRKTLTSCLSILAFAAASQSSTDAGVQLSASVSGPSQLTLQWVAAANSTQYTVYRKLKSGSTWGSVIAVLPGSATQYSDTVTPGLNYEYRVSRAGTNYSGHGYINCGISVPPIEHRGTVLLVIDSTFVITLAPELARLTTDMEGDGWNVKTIAVDRNGSPQHVKALILTNYNADSQNTKAVFLFGHVPVPYSGNINPDGHGDHFGAWPADVYYGDMNGTWTDVAGPGTTTNSPARTQNHPNDGKFDQSIISGLVELQVGRVDLANMPAFSGTGNEQQLLKIYLDKDHAYRKKLFVPKKRAIVDDNFGYFSGEAFAASGYKNFGPLVGPANINSGDYIGNLDTASFLWSYGCGGGSYTSAGGIGNTTNIAASDLKGTFSMLFGSYFGDWDVPNSFLRAPLASGSMLTNAWSGRPHYQFHHMAMGENIGYSLLTTQNYGASLYFGSVYSITGKWIHNALMGDPTLRNDVVAPVEDVVATSSGHHVYVTWTASSDTAVAGYNIYRKVGATRYDRLNAAPVTGTAYTDSCVVHPGLYDYLVRAIKLESTPSGTYYNMSEGISDTANRTNSLLITMQASVTVNGNTVTVSDNSSNIGTRFWDFGNGQTSQQQSATIVYTVAGNFVITLTVSNGCVDTTAQFAVQILDVTVGDIDRLVIAVFPNPGDGLLTLQGDFKGSLDLVDATGRVLLEKMLPDEKGQLNLQYLPAGVYLLRETSANGRTARIIVRK